MPKKKDVPSSWDKKSILVYIALPLLVGIILAAFIPRPVIGVIHLNNPIDDVQTTRAVRQIQYAQSHPEVRTVVLVMDCPGGTINGTELIYLELIKLRQTKPVVTMVEGMSASGAYYLAVGTDYIISNPSAMVGNVGVIGEIPEKPRVFEETYSTGPYKLYGFAQDSYIRQIDMMK
ncbi:MAG TPA: S49 family peptidase, partial [Bacteroidales bacterium]|nr:S49 family peptidase [Bacteroidales bacterium]